MNHRIIEWLGVILILGILVIVLFGCTTTPTDAVERNPLYWTEYKEITGRNLQGDLVTVKIPNGFRVCSCVSEIDSVNFECNDCDLYY